ncbi:globin-like [Ornithodoros turicata]|uniref:globin-like n=1 Tax=Ornithodoros turicata TaxID=34597 RepID=UPI0031395174
MGNLGGASKDIPDERTGLTRREIAVIRDTWAYFCRDLPGNSLAIFYTFFKRHPDYIKTFSLPEEEASFEKIFKGTFLTSHAIAVAYQLCATVDVLEDTDLLVALVRKNAHNHIHKRGVELVQFQNMYIVIRDVLYEKLDRKRTPKAMQAWDKMLTFQANVTRTIFNEERPSSAEDSPEGCPTTAFPQPAEISQGVRTSAGETAMK